MLIMLTCTAIIVVFIEGPFGDLEWKIKLMLPCSVSDHADMPFRCPHDMVLLKCMREIEFLYIFKKVYNRSSSSDYDSLAISGLNIH